MAEMNRAWVLVQRPVGDDFDSALKLQTLPMPELGEDQVLVRTLYLSLDPANRGWMAGPTYMPAVPVGVPMWGGVLGKVVKSNSPKFQPGDIIGGFGSWSDYCALPAGGVNKIPDMGGLPLAAAQGLFGGAGGTAYVGVIDIGQVKPGQIFVVSGAAGSVGSLAGQIAKIQGAKVVGIAGSAEKCAWLTNELGFDHAIDYQHENVRKRLAELCPDGVDVYFENVGGAVGNAVVANLAKGARVALCGLVSQYNADDGPAAGLDMLPILLKSCTVQGFILLDYLHRLGEASAKLGQWLAEGKVKYHADVTDGLENALEAFKTLFQSGASHKGKMMVRVDPSAN
ncbi:MAG: oxidoreductase, zinc-binding dehydrogenase family [Rhodospirillales bacterium]|nr:oxidoreductase, zinc-binding dehydrogenase family [Rhodospirillales bacterium]